MASLRDRPTDRHDRPGWRRFVLTFAAVFSGVLALLVAAVILIDPYDAGYFPSIIGPGAIDNNEYTNHASRARDAQFDAAIFANSHGQLLDPAELSKATGRSFVQLYLRGTGPRDQMLMMRFFLQHHPAARAIVLVADPFWCTHDPALPPPIDVPFPAWLYAGNRVEYLTHMLNPRMIRRMYLRVMMALGRVKPENRDGFSDYEVGAVWNFKPLIPVGTGAVSTTPQALHPDTSFPAIDQFGRLISTLPADTAIAIVMAPVFYTYMPSTASQEAVEFGACKDRLARLTAGRPHSGFADFMVDSPITRDPANFMDIHHMRRNVARLIDERIAEIMVAAPPPGRMSQ
jgi:hypothetical protein